MLFSYLDHMTGFYLCFSYLSILLTIFSPITVILQVFNGAFLSQCDELTVFNSSHIFSSDSVCIMGSCVNGEPIPSLLSVYRPRANHYHNRDRVLSYVQLSYPIETLITKRKPSDDGLYGQYSRNAGLKPGFGNYCHARVIETGHSPGIPIPGLTISCKNEPSNLIQVKRVSQPKSVHPSNNVSLPDIYIHNIRSLNGEKFNELKILASNHDLIFLTESWLTEAKETLYNIDGFQLHTCNRASKRTGGGVAVYVRDTLSVTKLSEYSNRSVSAYWLLLQQEGQTPIIYANIYHPPGLSKKSKEQTIEHIISTVSKQLQKHPNAKPFVAGDFNDLDTENITNILPLEQIVNFPTRGDNCLDLIFTDISEYSKSGCRPLPPILTNDHIAIHVPSTNRIPSPRYTTIKKRNITPATKIAVTEELSTLSWTDLRNAKTVDDKVSILHTTVNTILDKHCPMRSVRVPLGRPTLTSPLIRKLSRAKQRAHCKRNPAWKALSKMLSQQLRKQLSQQTSEKVNSTVTGSKNWWRNIKQLTGEHHRKSATPLISMNDSWLNISQFVHQLNNYYLEDHNSYTPNYPTIPETSRSTVVIDEMTVLQTYYQHQHTQVYKQRGFPQLGKQKQCSPCH